MNCQSCGVHLPDDAAYCHACGAFVDSWVEDAVKRTATEIAADDPNARANYDQIIRVLAPNEAAHFRQRAKLLIEQQNLSSVSAPAASAAPRQTRAAPERPPLNAPPVRERKAGAKKSALRHPVTAATLNSKPVPMTNVLLSTPAPNQLIPVRTQFSQVETVNTNGQRAAKKQNGFLFRFNELPEQIITAWGQVNPLLQERAATSKRFNQLGNQFIAAAVVILIGSFITLVMEQFVLAGIGGAAGLALLVIALGIFKPASRAADITSAHFDKRLKLGEQLLATLKLDMSPTKSVRGWLDLSESINENYIHSTGRSPSSGRPKTRYRHRWLQMAASLWDGTKLRLFITEDCKQRMGFYKRGSISGKMKLKPGSAASGQRVRVMLDFDPVRYQVDPARTPAAEAGSPIPGSLLRVKSVNVSDKRIDATVVGSDTNIAYWEVAAAMLYTRDFLQRK